MQPGIKVGEVACIAGHGRKGIRSDVINVHVAGGVATGDEHFVVVEDVCRGTPF